ncbi:GntR family transcriptional regulator [Rhodophyticola sp. CCM32]|uniref:GntR family transcriptional regulator n=1 Tax=Rhodophyticola sp. CCM32 TaxID=2916397 RepID=UPI00107EFEEE|nr:GntR family transcriptional regulator [Rhodophyticola sp. CCM32]QBX99417.1 GntR family transcriptional regulator [Rhodophyticola sp. CCM32]
MARVPLYRQAETEMLRRIRTGDWPVGQRLGNEFELAEEFGVSQGTMRRALMTLEAQGLLARKPGRGTIVSEPAAKPDEAAAPDLPGFDRLALPDGAAPKLEVFRSRSGSQRVDGDLAELLGEARALVIERMLKQGGIRFALDQIILPESLLNACDGEAAVDLPDLLLAHGVQATGIEDRLTASMCSMGESVALEVDRNSALLVLTRVARDASGRVLAQQMLKMAEGDVGYTVGLKG